MPGNSGGGSGNGCGSALIAGLVLGGIFTWLLMNSPSAAPAAVQQTGNSTATPSAKTISSVPVTVVNTDPKVEGVISHVVETPEPGVLPPIPCKPGQHASVGAQGYYILTFTCVDNPTLGYDVRLEAAPTAIPLMNETINSSSASNCVGCHNGSYTNLNEYSEWIQDGHSQVFTTPYFRTTYLGTDINGRPSQQILWNILPDGQKIYPLIDPMKPYYGPGYRLDYPARNGNCATCHVPAGFPETLQETNLVDLFNQSMGRHVNAETEGVTCDICHKVTDVQVDKNTRLPYDDRPGILSMSIAKTDLIQQLIYGPLAYQALNVNPNHKSACYPVFSESKFCAACHYGKFANTLIYGSYKEWLDSGYSKPGTSSYRTCQDCHMTDKTKVETTTSSDRAACVGTDRELQNFSHNMMNYGKDKDNPLRQIKDNPPWQTPLLVKDAARITLNPVLTGGQIQVKVTVESVGVGHKFPTDSPLRHLILLIEAQDWRGNELVQSGGPRIPVWAVPDHAGYAGQIFANILKDKDTNLAPSFAYWNPVESAWDGADTRLVPGVPVQGIYAFAAPYDRSATITAKLIYRRAFKNVVDQKSWPMENLDVQVTQTVMECNGFGADPQTITCNVVTPTPAPTATP